MKLVCLSWLTTLSVLAVRVSADIDYTVCDPANASVVPPPPPALAPSFSALIEWKWLETNTSTIVEAYHDGINQMSSQIITVEGQTSRIIYDHKENQYITINDSVGCLANGLGSIVFFQDKFWLASINMIYDLVTKGDVEYINQTVVRGTRVNHWRSCIYLYGTMEFTTLIDTYFSSVGWGMAESIPSNMVPVRFEIVGSGTKNGSVPQHFHVIGDIINYNPTPKFDMEKIQPPPGLYCSGRKSRNPIIPLSPSFSAVLERIDQDLKKITYESIWFDADKKLVRRDYKDAIGSDPDPSTEIFDFNLGVHYSIDPYMGTCENPSILQLGDLYVQKNGSRLRMQTSMEFFHMNPDNVQYVGTRWTRGALCDVWIGTFLDPDAGRNETVEWYYTKQDWVEAVDLTIKPAALYRMDVWKGGSFNPIVHNIVQWNGVAPLQSAFNVGPCYSSQQKNRIIAHFTAMGGRLDQVSRSFLKDRLHTELVNQAQIPPLRLSDALISLPGTNDVYFAVTLVDQAPVVNPSIFPSTQKQHSLKLAYNFLYGTMARPIYVNVTNTLGQTVVLVSQSLVQINYADEFTTLPTTTTLSTTEKTPAPPTLAPTTAKQLAPSLETATTILYPPTKPLSTSPLTKTSTTASSSKKTSIPSQSNRPRTQSTSVSSQSTKPRRQSQAPCSCPKLSCPPFTSTQKPVTCPTLPATTTQKPVTCPTLPQSHTQSPHSPSSTSRVPVVLPYASKNPKTTGMEGGIVALIAVAMLVVGLILGAGALTAIQKYKNRRDGSDATGLFNKYLDDERHY